MKIPQDVVNPSSAEPMQISAPHSSALALLSTGASNPRLTPAARLCLCSREQAKPCMQQASVAGSACPMPKWDSTGSSSPKEAQGHSAGLGRQSLLGIAKAEGIYPYSSSHASPSMHGPRLE